MKNYTLILILTCALIFKAHAQVANTLTNVTVSNGSYSAGFINCNTINIVTNSSTTQNTFTLFYTLSRGASVSTGLGDIKVMLKYNNFTTPTQVGYRQVPEADWAANQATGIVGATFSNSAVQDSGSSIYLEYKTQGGTIVKSCEYPITKTPPPPSFSFSPTSLSLACGDVGPKTFTVTGSYIPSGANVTYQWSFNGWSGSSGSSSSKTLTPLSGTVLPSHVSVTPFIDGVAKPTMTCNVSRATMLTNDMNITGNSNICTGSSSNFTLAGVGTNNTVIWSSSDITVGTLSTISSSQVTLNGVSNGLVTLIAIISNTCGESKTLTKTIWVGKPIIEDFSNSSFCQGGGQREQNSIQIGSKSTLDNYQWIICEDPTISPCLNTTGVSFIGNTNQAKVYFDVPNTASGIPVFVRAQNSCGWSEWSNVSRYAENCNATDPGCIQCYRTSPKKFTIYPNPSKDIVNIDLRDQNNKSEENATISGELFDMMGQSKSKVGITNNKATFSVRGLSKGIYVLKIYINDQLESHQIVVE